MPSFTITRATRRLALVAALVSSIAVVAIPMSPARAIVGPTLYYSWGQGTNTISRNANGTTTDTWSSATGTGAATGVAADGTYVYWANGQKIFRQAITSSAGGTAPVFVNITGWNNAGTGAGTDGGGQRTIKHIAVDGTHIYIAATRGYDGVAVLRADKSTGLQDTSWTWGPAGGREAGGITVGPGANDRVFLQWGNSIGYATKSATAGAPTTSNYNWSACCVGNNSFGSDLVGVVNDGTYIYFRGSTETVYRRLMSADAGAGGGYGESVTTAIPAGTIKGLAINLDTGIIYASSSLGASNTYTVYSVTPDAVSPAAFTSYTTFTSTSGSMNGMVALPTPASAPTITSQPTAQSATAGQSATFTVAASSTDSGVLSYQWKKDGTDVAGATSATYTINPVALSHAGTYTVVVTNTLGSSTATTVSGGAVLTVSAAPTTTTSTTVAATTTVAAATSVAGATTAASQLVTTANQAQLEASPGDATAVINGRIVEPQVVKVEATASQAEILAAGRSIVNTLEALTPAGSTNPVRLVNTTAGPVLTDLMTNPDDPTEKLDIPVESVTLVKAGDSAVLISALNQTNLPAEVAPGGAIEVTRGGIMAARAFGLGSSETGEIVLMSTPRLLSTFTVDKSGSYSGQVPLPKDISFGSHTVVMATKNAKVSLGIKLVRTRMQFRVKRVISTRLFKNRAGVKPAGGAISVTAEGRCTASNTRIRMGTKAGGCYITVRQAAKGDLKAVYFRFTVSVVKRLTSRAGK